MADQSEPVIVVPIEAWEQLRRKVSQLHLVRDQYEHVTRELDRIIGDVDEQQTCSDGPPST